MKKIFVVLIMLLSVFGCSKTEPEKVEINYLDMPSVYKADMSDYPGMKAFDHNFIGISAEELLNARRNGGSGLFYLGYNDCHYCREAVRYLNEVAKENEPTGEMSVKDLVGKGGGAKSIEVSDDAVKTFRKVANKYNVDFAVHKDDSEHPPKFLVFFQGKDTRQGEKS